MSDDNVLRFSTPDPVDGPPIQLDIEVVRFVERSSQRPDDAPEDWQPSMERVPERETHTFYAKPDVSGAVLAQLELMAAGSKPGRKGVNTRGGDALYDFFDATLLDPDGFRKVIDDPQVYVHAKVLSDIAVALYTRYSSRPMKSPGD